MRTLNPSVVSPAALMLPIFEPAAISEDFAPVRLSGGSKAMAGSPDAFPSRRMTVCEKSATFPDHAWRGMAARDSVSPSCSWPSPLRENHERQSQCSISTVLNWTGVAAS
jgi:hypothetical protein